MLTIDKFEEASEVVKRVTQDTKLIFSDYFSQMTGNKVYFKPENMQRTGAYKLRGAYYKISTLTEEERAKGLITASAGNHAQGVAYAAKAYGAKAVIVMPTTTPLIKVERTKSYGAEVVLYGVSMTGIVLFSTTARIRPAPPRGIRTSTYRFSFMNAAVVSLEVSSMRSRASGFTFASDSVRRMQVTIAWIE